MRSKVLSPDAVLEIKRLYEVRNARGRQVHSHMSLGKMFGVSETTIMRALNNYGTFMDAPTPLPDTPEVAARIKASQEKLLKILADDAKQPGEQNGRPAKKARLNPKTGEQLAENERWDEVDGKVVVIPYY